MPKSSNVILITHIPKTAGTSLRVALEKAYGAKRVCRDYGADSKKTSPVVKQCIYGTTSFNGAAFLHELDKSNTLALIGHYPQAKYGLLIPPERQMAFIRNPIARTASEFLHLSRYPDENLGFLSQAALRLLSMRPGHAKMDVFEEYIERPEMQNRQYKLLLDRQPGMFIGITEQYSLSIDLINARYGLTLIPAMHNVAPQGGAARFIESLPAALVDRYEQLNALDIQLYTECKSELKQLSMESK